MALTRNEVALPINNSKDSSVGGVWSNPGISLYNMLITQPNWRALLQEAYLIAPVGRINARKDESTSFSASGVGYPHHVIRNGQLVLHRTGLRAAFSRAQQQGIVNGEIEAHLVRHYKEMGWYEESTISEDETTQADPHLIDAALSHFGIMGMKWGIRRKVGPDGRVGKSTVLVSPDYKKKSELRRKPMSQLSNQEIKELKERMQLEQDYARLSKKDITKGQAFRQKFMQSYGRQTIIELVTRKKGEPFNIRKVVGIGTVDFFFPEGGKKK